MHVGFDIMLVCFDVNERKRKPSEWCITDLHICECKLLWNAYIAFGQLSFYQSIVENYMKSKHWQAFNNDNYYGPLKYFKNEKKLPKWFSSIASLVTCFKPEKKSHEATLNIFGTDFLCNSKRKNYFLPPMNMYLNQQGKMKTEFSKQICWPYADTYHIPIIKKCLAETREENRVATIPHYLKKLRDWVTYGDAYLFIRLYGEVPKEDLDCSLRAIAFVSCAQAEFFLLRLYGWNAVYRQLEYFLQQMETNLKTSSEPLNARFHVYSRIARSFHRSALHDCS